MLDSPPLPSVDKLLSPPASTQVVGLLAELIQGYSCLASLIRSDVDDLKARLAFVEKAQASPGPVQAGSVKSEPVKLELTPLLGAHRQFLRSVVRNDIEAARSTLKIAPSLANKKHVNGWYPIHAAILTGNLAMVKLIFEYDGDCLSRKDSWTYKADSDSLSPEEYRTREDELGAKAKVTKTEDCTALHLACWIGSLDIMKYLIENGASMEATDFAGREPYEYSDILKHADVLKEFHILKSAWSNRRWQFGVESTIDDCMSAVRSKDFIRFTVHVKANPELLRRQTYYDFYLLQMATIHRLPEFVKLILEVDKSVINQKDCRSCYSSDFANESFANERFPHRFVKDATALHYACLTGNLQIIEMLLKAGADWTLTDWKDRTPEQLIFDNNGSNTEVKDAFILLRNKEDARGKGSTAEKPDSEANGDVDGERNECDGSDNVVDGDGAQIKATDSKSERANGISPVRGVSNAIHMRENGSGDQPLVMLFLGNSCVGKTELAKQVSLHKHGKRTTSTHQSELLADMEQEGGFIRIDMSKYRFALTMANTTGSPKNHIGSLLRKNPKSVVLLDEIEKAHSDVLTVFRQIFNDGQITDSEVGVVSCKEAVFIMTSNYAIEHIKRKASVLRKLITDSEEQGRSEEHARVTSVFDREIYPQLRAGYDWNALLERINQIVVFLPLNDEEIATVVHKELDVRRRRAEENHTIKLSWSREAAEKIAKAYDFDVGVRSVMREVHRITIQLISDARARGELKENWLAYFTVDEVGDVVLQSVNPSETVKVRRGCRFFLY